MRAGADKYRTGEDGRVRSERALPARWVEGRRFSDDVADIAAHIAGNAGTGRGGDTREIGQRLGFEPSAALRDNV